MHGMLVGRGKRNKILGKDSPCRLQLVTACSMLRGEGGVCAWKERNRFGNEVREKGGRELGWGGEEE